MLPLALNGLYAALLLAISPWLLYRRFVQRKPIAGLRQKLSGRIERRDRSRPCVWFHAVSVGEVLQLQSLIIEFAALHPDYEILITTTTGTGFDVARQKFPQHTIAYWPFDFLWAVNRALRTVSPDLVVLVELELWPNFLLAARRREVPMMLINGRIGAKSHRGYARVTWLWRRVLPALTQCGVQTAEFAQRLIDLGVPAERVVVTGNIKYDRIQSDRHNSKTEELRRSFGIRPDELVFVAGSTQEPEEQYAMAAWQHTRQAFPNVRLILVPRHKERFDEVARMIESYGLPLQRRSDLVPSPPRKGERGPEKQRFLSRPSTLNPSSSSTPSANSPRAGDSPTLPSSEAASPIVAGRICSNRLVMVPQCCSGRTPGIFRRSSGNCSAVTPRRWSTMPTSFRPPSCSCYRMPKSGGGLEEPLANLC